MNKTKEKGVTIIALIVTVIILLIISTVVILSASGNGLFQKADTARVEYLSAQEEEYNIIQGVEYNIDKDSRAYISVQFDSNGGTGSMPALSNRIDTDTKLAKNSFEKEGYDFVSWNTKKDGSGINYNDEQTINTPGNMTLYAQWRKITIVNIKINLTGQNGNNVSGDLIITYTNSSGNEVTETHNDNTTASLNVKAGSKIYLKSGKYYGKLRWVFGHAVGVNTPKIVDAETMNFTVPYGDGELTTYVWYSGLNGVGHCIDIYDLVGSLENYQKTDFE